LQLCQRSTKHYQPCAIYMIYCHTSPEMKDKF
jgi:hypothetical protein